MQIIIQSIFVMCLSVFILLFENLTFAIYYIKAKQPFILQFFQNPLGIDALTISFKSSSNDKKKILNIMYVNKEQ